MKRKKDSREIINAHLAYMPPAIREELSGIFGSSGSYPTEVCIRGNAVSDILLRGERIRLTSRATASDIEAVFRLVSGGSVYAHRDTLAEGYLTDPYGIRVGIAADARYDAGRLVGISSLRSLVFRLPLYESSHRDALFSIWQSSRGGMLIYSLPGCGKTSAIRALAYLIARSGKRAVAVDERYEFSPADFSDTGLDILRGYRKEKGIEIAVRSLSAEVVIIDEIGSESEALSILAAAKTGVPTIATAHADSLKTLLSREGVGRLIKDGIFDKFVRLYKENGSFFMKEETE